jgi:hypothetical protein
MREQILKALHGCELNRDIWRLAPFRESLIQKAAIYGDRISERLKETAHQVWSATRRHDRKFCAQRQGSVGQFWTFFAATIQSGREESPSATLKNELAAYGRSLTYCCS